MGDIDALRRLSGSLTLDAIMAGLDVLTTTKTRMRAGSHPQVLLEMAVVRLSRLGELVPLAKLAEALRLGSFEAGGANAPVRSAPSTARVAPPELSAPAIAGMSLSEMMAMKAKPSSSPNPVPVKPSTPIRARRIPCHAQGGRPQ